MSEHGQDGWMGVTDFIQLLNDLRYLEGRGALRGVAAIVAERTRQIRHGYGAEHDAGHDPGWLAGRASVTANACARSLQNGRTQQVDPVRGLPAAGAMVAAEIDRMLAGPEQAGYRCWTDPGGPGENGYTHHAHGPDQPCPLYGGQ